MEFDETTPSVDPGRPGPYSVCTSEPTVFYKTKRGVGVHVLAYAPGVPTSATSCRAIARSCPLVVIFHANPDPNCPPNAMQGEYYKSYGGLGSHLASHGYVVMCVQWGTDEAAAANGAMAITLLQWINKGGMGLKSVLSNRLVLVGHSRGGQFAQSSTGPILADPGLGWSIRAVIQMSPAYKNEQPLAYGDIGAFLGIYNHTDCDPSANGAQAALMAMPIPRVKSVVWGYEVAGAGAAGTINSQSTQFPKHLLYFRKASPPGDYSECAHFYQNEPAIQSYVCAFLMGWVRDDALIRRAYFREMAPIVSTESSLMYALHMHAEPGQLVLLDGAFGEKPQVQSGTVETISLQPAVEDGMLSHGLALMLTFVRGAPCEIALPVAPLPLVGYTHITIGICQRGMDGDATIFPTATFSGEGGEASIKGLVLPSHPSKLCGLFNEVPRRTCMTEWSFSLDLLAANGLDTSKGVATIRLNFEDSEAEGADAVVFIGMIKAIGISP